MNLRSLFGKKIKSSHLLKDDINHESLGSIEERIDYAWSVYSEKRKKYKAIYKEAALAFLLRTFNINPLASKMETHNHLMQLMQLRESNQNKNYIPNVSDIRDPAQIEVELPPVIAASPSTVQSAKSYAAASPSAVQSASSYVAPTRAEFYLRPLRLVPLPKSAIDNKTSQFISEVNANIGDLNTCIYQYNSGGNLKEKQQVLLTIFEIQKSLTNKYPPMLITQYESFREEIHTNLFTAIQEQFAKLGAGSLNESLISFVPTALPNPNCLPEILTNMPPDVVGRFANILAYGRAVNLEKLKSLFYSSERGYEEFKVFLATHTFKYLGGGNSQNFLLINKTNGHKFVIKLENTLNMPKSNQMHLRSHNLTSVLAPIAAVRQATYKAPDGKSISGHLIITEHYQGGNLTNHSSSIVDIERRMESALNIYLQMAAIVKAMMDEDGSCFPDMKNSNWLIDSDDKIWISDAKSFLFVENGLLNIREGKNTWSSFTSTEYMDPPEFDTLRVAFSADKMHTYLLGKNLYHYLTLCSAEFLIKKHSFADADFNYPIFTGNIGQLLKALIMDCVKPNAAERLSMDVVLSQFKAIKLIKPRDEALKILAKIKSQTADHVGLKGYLKRNIDAINATNTVDELVLLSQQLLQMQNDTKEVIVIKNRCLSILKQIEKFAINEKDPQINLFLVNRNDEIIHAQTDADLKAILARLESSLALFTADRATPELKRIINMFRQQSANVGSYGRRHKADQIEEALYEVPLEERANIYRSESSAAYKVLHALAEKRSIFGTSNIIKTGKIDAKDAAEHYGNFMKAMMLAPATPAARRS